MRVTNADFWRRLPAMTTALHQAPQTTETLDPWGGHAQRRQSDPHVGMRPGRGQNRPGGGAQQSSVEPERPEEHRRTLDPLRPKGRSNRSSDENGHRNRMLVPSQTRLQQKQSSKDSHRRVGSMINDADGPYPPLVPGIGDPFGNRAQAGPGSFDMKNQPDQQPGGCDIDQGMHPRS